MRPAAGAGELYVGHHSRGFPNRRWHAHCIVLWHLKMETCHERSIRHFCPFLLIHSSTFAINNPAKLGRINGKCCRFRPYFPGSARRIRRFIFFGYREQR
jgi:hypothetical protein